MLATSHSATAPARAATRLSPAELKLQQIRVLASCPVLPPPIARIACAIVAAADDDGLLMLTARELAALGSGYARLATTAVRDLDTAGFVDADLARGYAVALRITLTGPLLVDELDSCARRLREARRRRV